MAATSGSNWISTPSFTGLGDLRLVRVLARWLAAEDLSVSLVGADGLVLSLGAGQRSLLSRMLVRSKHVQLGPRAQPACGPSANGAAPSAGAI